MIQSPYLVQYLIESSLCLLLFHFAYKILLQHSTFFQLSRGYLLLGAGASFFIPILNFELSSQETLPLILPLYAGNQYFSQGIVQMSGQSVPLFSISIGDVLLMVYALGVVFFSLRFLFQIKVAYQGARHGKAKQSASFFGWVFIQPEHKNQPLVLEHELVHVRQWHSLDVVLMELLRISNWFNPIVHFYVKNIREVHEFIADRHVAGIAETPYHYARLVAGEIHFKSKLSNNFSSLIKKRLIMLSSNASDRKVLVRYLSVIPMLLLMLGLFSMNTADSLSRFGDLGESAEIFGEKDLFTLPSRLKDDAIKRDSTVDWNGRIFDLTSDFQEISLTDAKKKCREAADFYLNLEGNDVLVEEYSVFFLPFPEKEAFDHLSVTPANKIEMLERLEGMMTEGDKIVFSKLENGKRQRFLHLKIQGEKEHYVLQWGTHFFTSSYEEEQDKPSFKGEMTASDFKRLYLNEDFVIIKDGKSKNVGETFTVFSGINYDNKAGQEEHLQKMLNPKPGTKVLFVRDTKKEGEMPELYVLGVSEEPPLLELEIVEE